jgi:hypothetical protein
MSSKDCTYDDDEILYTKVLEKDNQAIGAIRILKGPRICIEYMGRGMVRTPKAIIDECFPLDDVENIKTSEKDEEDNSDVEDMGKEFAKTIDDVCKNVKDFFIGVTQYYS